MIRRILVIGIGGIGGKVVESFLHKNRRTEDKIVNLCIDTDISALKDLEGTQNFAFIDADNLGNVVLKLNRNKIVSSYSFLSEENSSFVNILPMDKSSNGWREKALLAFEDFLSKEENKNSLNLAMDSLLQDYDGEGEVEIYTAASLFGGTGSGLLLPIVFYVKKYLSDKYGVTINSQAVLVCPSVIENEVNNEQKVKAFANAYATLRELNAVNTLTDGENEQKDENFCHFTLGDNSDEYIGLLFDSDDEKFCNEKFKPFSKIYLFDKVPGITTVNEHLSLLYSLFYNVYTGISANNQLNDNSLYNALSVIEIKYPVDRLAEYLAGRVVLDSIDGEWLSVQREISSTVFNQSKNPIIKTSEVGIADIFANNLITVVDDVRDKIIESKFVLHRENGDVLKMSDVYQLVEQVISDAFGYVSDILDYGDLNVDDVMQKDNFLKLRTNKVYTFKRLKYKRRGIVQDKINLVYGGIESVCDEAIKKYLETERELTASVFNADKESNPILSLIKEGDNFVHPAVALERLSIFKILVEWNIINDRHRIDKNEESFYDRYSKYLKTDIKGEDGKSVYYFEYNLSELLEASGYNLKISAKKPKEVKKLKRSHQKTYSKTLDGLIVKKQELRLYFKEFYKDVICDIESRAFFALLDGVNVLITAYKRILEGLEYNLTFEKRELNSVATACSKNDCIEFNVGADNEDKERLYNEYKSAIGIDGLKARDGKFGEIVFSEVVNAYNKKELRSIANKSADIVEKSIKAVMAEIKESKTFEVMSDRCAFEYIGLNSDGLLNCDKFYSGLKRMLGGGNLPLVLDKASAYSEGSTLRISSKVVLSEKNLEYLLKNGKELGINYTEPQAALKELLLNLGNYDRYFEVSSSLPSGVINIVNEYSQFNLSSISGVSEIGDMPRYYECYMQAEKIREEQNALMWSLDIFGSRQGKAELPYISLNKQKRFALQFGKAVLYAFMHDELFLCKSEENGEGVFYYNGRNGFTQITYDGKGVLQSEIYKIVKFIRSDKLRVENYAEAYDKIVNDACLELPPMTSGLIGVEKLTEALKKSKIHSAFVHNIYSKRLGAEMQNCADLHKFIGDMIVQSDKESILNAEYVVYAAYETVKKLCAYRTLPDNSEAYNSVKKVLIEAYLSACNEKDEGYKLIKKYFK